MSPAVAPVFLIAGPITTLLAMAAVWSLVSHRVFAMYVSFALVGAIVLSSTITLVQKVLNTLF